MGVSSIHVSGWEIKSMKIEVLAVLGVSRYHMIWDVSEHYPESKELFVASFTSYFYVMAT